MTAHEWYDPCENSPPEDMVTWECRRCGMRVNALSYHLPNERWGRNVDCDERVLREVLES